MLNRLQVAVLKAQNGHYAIPAFNFDNLAMAQAIVSGARQCQAPVILMISEKTLNNYGSVSLVWTLMKTVQQQSSHQQIFLWFDHGHNLALCQELMAQGIDGVMLDYSKASYSENTTATKALATAGHQQQILVEGEIGHVGGKDQTGGDQNVFTDPDQALMFSTATNVDLLAVSVGNQHGLYHGQPELKIDLIQAIRKKCSTPLVLHGSSNLPPAQVQAAIAAGICKVNIGTDLKVAYREAVEQWLGQNPTDHDLRNMHQFVVNHVQAKVVEWIRICQAQGRAQ